MIILSVFYAGGYMMNDSLITIGELSAFLLYAAYVGVAMGGNCLHLLLILLTTQLLIFAER